MKNKIPEMQLPADLMEIIKKALNAIEHNQNGNLNLGYRQAIWAQFGPGLHPDIPESRIAHQKRAFLDILTIKHVLPLWEKKWPEDQMPQYIIDKAEDILLGKQVFEGDKGFECYDEFWAYFDNKLSNNVSTSVFTELVIGYGAALAFYNALADINIDYNHIRLDLADAEDIFEADVAQMVAIAVAHGSAGDANSDPQKRRSFWQWWLTEAIPKAWNNER